MQPKHQKLFRQEALAHLSAPERLDHVMQVVHPLAWLSSQAIGFLVAIAEGWSLFGGIPSNRVRTPTLLQLEVVECGAAALGIILGYYGCKIPLAELRSTCGVSRDGTKAIHILRAAQHYGLTAKGLSVPLEQLKILRPPYIVFWDFNHFVVVEGIAKKCVYLNDPATGRRTVSLEEFDHSYTGVVLVMEPGTGFQKKNAQRHLVSALKSRLQNSRNALLFCLITGWLLTVPRLAIPAFSQVFIDEILIHHHQHWLYPLLLGIALTAMSQGTLAKLRLACLRKLMLRLSIAMSGQFLWHTLRLPIGFYAQRLSGEIGTRIQLNDSVAAILSGRLATTAIDAVMMVFYGALMSHYDGQLSAIAFGFAGINLVTLRLLAQKQVDANLRLSLEKGKVTGMTIAAIQAIETVKASGLESDLFARFANGYAKTLNLQQTLGLQTQTLLTLPTILNALSAIAILVAGGLKVMHGDFSLGMLVAYQSLTQSFLTPVNSLVNFGSTLQTLEAHLNYLDDVLQYPIDPEATRQPTRAIGTVQGQVELRNLTFGYNRLDTAAIADLSFTVQPGQRVAIVGSSGSGKSTLAKLICGLYEPWKGDILIDGVPRTQISRSELAANLAMVAQDIFWFSGTIRENLTLWDATVPEADLVRACKDAAIYDLVRALPGQFEAELIEGGMNLSGGQRQRLEIARALVRNPAVLVLDEATSALDTETEWMIDQNLRQRGCTCIVIAHRLSTIRDCHEIIVLDQGKIVQRGTHTDLWQQGGTYKNLLQAEEE